MAFSLRQAALVVLAVCACAAPAASQYTARLLSEDLNDNNVFSATYSSVLFGGDVTIQVTPESIYFVTFAPSSLATSSKNAIPMNETFPLPANASTWTMVDHVAVMYNPQGAFPYPSGMKNPLWDKTIAKSLPCITCWFYITFFYIPTAEQQSLAASCTTSPNLFCSTDPDALATPDQALGFLPKSYVPASGDFYSQIKPVVKSSTKKKVAAPATLTTVTTTYTPMIGAMLGQLWVSGKKAPYLYTYNGTNVLAPENYYVTNAGEVIGVGQVVNKQYFDFFSAFFAKSASTTQKLVATTGPFDIPKNYSSEGFYPAKASTLITGAQGTSTYSFGFTNTTFRFPPPNPASKLLLNLPWLMATVWIAGALVLLTDQL